MIFLKDTLWGGGGYPPELAWALVAGKGGELEGPRPTPRGSGGCPRALVPGG